MAKVKAADMVTMFNIDEQGRVVTHHFPWTRGSEKYEPLKARGFTFERPAVEMPLISKEDASSVTVIPTLTSTIQDKRLAALKKARAAKAAKKGA